MPPPVQTAEPKAATQRSRNAAYRRRRIEFAAAYQSECAAEGRYGALKIACGRYHAD